MVITKQNRLMIDLFSKAINLLQKTKKEMILVDILREICPSYIKHEAVQISLRQELKTTSLVTETSRDHFIDTLTYLSQQEKDEECAKGNLFSLDKEELIRIIKSHEKEIDFFRNNRRCGECSMFVEKKTITDLRFDKKGQIYSGTNYVGYIGRGKDCIRLTDWYEVYIKRKNFNGKFSDVISFKEKNK